MLLHLLVFVPTPSSDQKAPASAIASKLFCKPYRDVNPSAFTSPCQEHGKQPFFFSPHPFLAFHLQFLSLLSVLFPLFYCETMKIPVVCHDRFSSSSAGDLVGQFLGSLCLQYVAMDRSHPAVDVVLRESYVSPLEQQQEQTPCISECSVGASVEEYNLLSEGLSKSLLSHESASLFHSASDHLDDAVEFWRKESSHLLASTGASSSSTELSESELRSAEVNPVTFEVVPPSTQNGQRSDMVAAFRMSREHRATSRLSEDVDSASDGDSSHSAVCHSYSHSGGPPSPTTISVALERSFHPSEEACRSRVKLMCSFGGRIVSRPDDGKLKYVGGETRILAVNRDIGYNEFMSKMAHFHGQPLSLKYQLPHEHLDAFISISSDDDLQNMLEEYDKLELNGGVSRLRLFFFTSPVEHETQRVSRNDSEDHCSRSEQCYVDAINSVQEKISDNHRENDETGFRQAGAANFSGSRMHHVDSSTGLPWSVSPVKTFARVPVTPSSPPLSPSAAIRQAHLKPLRVGDSSFQVSMERLDNGTTANGSGSPSCTSRVDYQYRKPSESPSRRTQHEISVSRGESWQTQAGMRRDNSQTRLMRQSEQQTDYGTAAGLTDVQQASEMPMPAVERQRVVYQQHKRIPQQQQQLAWQSPMEGNLGRGETMQRRPSDVHIQPHAFHLPREAVHQLHQATQLCVHQTAADYDGRARDMEVQGVPSFLQGPSYQMGSAPSSPRITHNCKGRCNCAQQHSQVHRGINVCLNDQSYTRRTPRSGNSPNRKYGLPPHMGDQPARKHGFPDSVGLYDNVPHCGERMTWLQHTGHFTPQEADTGNAWRQVPAQCHVAECKTINRGPRYCDSPLFTEAFLSSHDQCEMSKTRCVCSSCYDGRREPLGLPVYIGMQDQVGGWVTHQRSLELDNGTTYTPGPGQTPLCRDGDWRGGLEVAERSGAEGELYCKNAQGKSKRPLPIAVGVPCHGNVTGRVLPKSQPLTPEDSHNPEASTTSSCADVKQYSNLVTPKASPVVSSWTNPSIEASVRTDIPPSPISHVPHVLSEEDFMKISLSEEMPTTDSTTDSLLVKDGPSGLKKDSAWKPLPTKGNRDQVQGRTAGESFVRDDTGRLNPPSSVAGEAATELLPVPSLTRNRFTNGCESDQTSPNYGCVHLLSQNVIPVGSLVHLKVASSSAQQALAPGVSSMAPSEGLTSPTSPTYVRSPLNKTGSTGLYLEPSKATLVKGLANLDKKGLMSSMSITGLLLDGKISSVLKSCSNKEHCDESKNVDHEVIDVKLKEAKKNDTEQDTKTVIGALNSNSASFEKGKDYSVKCSEAANEWLKVSAEKEQLPGMVPVLHNRMTKKIAYEEKDVVAEIEGNGVALRQSEADTRARGLQIIQNADLEDLRELGSGTFGTVFHGKWRGSDVAIKRIKASCFMGRPSEQERLISDFWKEARTLSQLHHPNIVALYGVVPDGPEGALATVTEYMVNGSLKKVLRKKDRTIDRRKRLIIAMGAAFGMEYLHSKNIVHFDLKCDNLLVNMKDAQRPICKVGDFGLSKVKHRTMVSGGVRGTIPWMAPELLSCNSNMVTEKIDVFSFGIVMWELLTGEEPYANMHHGTIIGGIVKNTLRPSIPSWCEPGWRALMERCWSGDPADRPPFSEVATELRALAASINVR